MKKSTVVWGSLLFASLIVGVPAHAYYVGVMQPQAGAVDREPSGFFGKVFGDRKDDKPKPTNNSGGGNDSGGSSRFGDDDTPVGQRPYSTSKRTHLIVVGQADDAGTSFFKAGITRAMRYRELYPNDQIVVTINHERFTESKDNPTYEKDKAQYDRTVRDVGSLMEGLRSNNTIDFVPQINRAGNPIKLGGDLLMQLIAGFSPGTVASVDLFGHSSVHLGLGLETSGNRLNFDSNHIDEAHRAFAPGAYMTLNSCNSGFFLAPFLAKRWRDVAVLGTFTEANYQRPHEDGNYYFDDHGLFPEDAKTLGVNNLSFFKPASLPGGAIMIRLHPGNATYGNMWSFKEPLFNSDGSPKLDEKGKPAVKNHSFETGLGFFKAFCPALVGGTNQERDNCLQGISSAFMGFPSILPVRAGSPIADFKKAAADYLCNPAQRAKRDEPTPKRDGCLQAIKSFDEEIEKAAAENNRTPNEKAFSSFSASKPLECKFDGCKFDMTFFMAGDSSRQMVTCHADMSCSDGSDMEHTGQRAARGSINFVATTDGGGFSLFREYRAIMEGVKRHWNPQN